MDEIDLPAQVALARTFAGIGIVGPAPAIVRYVGQGLAVRVGDRQDPGIGATLVFDLDRKRLVRSTGSGPTILFDDQNVPVRVDAATIEWEVAHNAYALNRATLELDVIGRVYVCQLAKRQL